MFRFLVLPLVLLATTAAAQYKAGPFYVPAMSTTTSFQTALMEEDNSKHDFSARTTAVGLSYNRITELNDSVQVIGEFGGVIKFMRANALGVRPLFNYFFHEYRVKAVFGELNALGIDAAFGYSHVAAMRVRSSWAIGDQGLTWGLLGEIGIDLFCFSAYGGVQLNVLNPKRLDESLSTLTISVHLPINGAVQDFFWSR